MVSAGYNFGAIDGVVIWSVYCEMFYYAAYPLLRFAHHWLKWKQITAVAYLSAGIVLWIHRDQNEFLNLGIWAASVVGLPCWLLGVMLAETTSAPWKVNRRVIKASRIGVYVLACLATVMRFHAGIGFPLSLVFFAIACYAWLRFEIAWRREHPSPAWLENGGAWSYSLYLLHLPASAIVTGWLADENSVWLRWSATIASALLLSYAYYLAVEKPAHLLAKFLGGRADRIQARFLSDLR